MKADLFVRARTLGQSSDLTLLAPLKPGFVESLDSVTYKTRTQRVLDALHGARQSAHEHARARLLSDAVERVGAILSVRVAVLEPQDQVLLSVSFDGPYQAYIRVLWDKVGTLLDLIFCGTVGYVTAWEHGFDEWLQWARRVQIETGFFYAPPEATARDLVFDRRIGSMQRRGVPNEKPKPPGYIEAPPTAPLRARVPSAEAAVQRLVNLDPRQPDDPQLLLPQPVAMVRERVRVGLQNLAGLYRLADWHRPGTADGDMLRRAALQLLLEFVQMHDDHMIQPLLVEARERFARQLDWLFPDDQRQTQTQTQTQTQMLTTQPPPVALQRARPAPATAAGVVDPAIRRDIQSGVIHGYDDATHGLALLLAFADPAQAYAFLGHVRPRITNDASPPDLKAGELAWNIAFTAEGLRAVGVGEDVLECMPEEFVQGMAARAGLLGDVHDNHPRRWRLPGRYVHADLPPASDRPVELDAVHAVLQWRCRAATPAQQAALELHDPEHPLRPAFDALLAAVPGLCVLSTQTLRRRFRQQDGEPVVVEHFGYADGNGQPDIEPKRPRHDRNRIHLGEIVNGHDNACDMAPDPADPALPPRRRLQASWLRNSSFLAMRKYRQFVGRLEAAVTETAAAMVAGGVKGDDGKPLAVVALRELVYGKLMGRLRDGTSMVTPELTDPARRNVFDYDDDDEGSQCPLHAHVRRAHPRGGPADGVHQPRLMRRSMSYGPERTGVEGGGERDRGLLFMAYFADLGEQFEVVQRWLVGGNSSGSTSAVGCPVVGPAAYGEPRVFAFEHEGQVFRVRLDENSLVFDDPRAPTRLEWGLYLFSPGIATLSRLASCAADALARAPAAVASWDVDAGRRELARLLGVQQRDGDAAAAAAWKAALEDADAIDRQRAAALWAAVRADHGGLLRTPYGTLVCSRELMHTVLHDDSRYSVTGQRQRIGQSFGDIYLCMDAGPAYAQQSREVNAAIGRLTLAEVFDLSIGSVGAKIDAIVDEAQRQARRAQDNKFEVGFDVRELTDHLLADLCEEWFGLRQHSEFDRGGTDWSWKTGQLPLYPGHFTALSRYMFQPNPGPMPVELGCTYGQALREAMLQFVRRHRAAGTLPQRRGDAAPAPLAQAIFEHPSHGADDDWVARTMVGVLMGFNPTIIGAVLNVLREWQRDGRFGALRVRLGGATDLATAQQVLLPAMHEAALMRPMPPLTWRTVLEPHRLGSAGAAVDLQAGDKLVLSLVSVGQQSLADGQDDGRSMFGGDRSQAIHPTHACPGYAAAIGAMLGALAALLARPENLRPSSASLSFMLDGALAKVPSPPPPAAADAGAATATAFGLGSVQAVRRAAAVRARQRVLGWGDSWLDYSDPVLGLPVGVDLRDQLEDTFALPRDFCQWTRWKMVANMAAAPQYFCEFLTNELQLRRPRAVVLSGGGNDSTEDAMAALILDKGSAGRTLLEPTALQAHIGALERHFLTILGAVDAAFKSVGEDPVPVFMHGYDYPIPTDKPFYRPWLYEPFKRHGYDFDIAHDRALAAEAMVELIDAFNTMQLGLPNKTGFGYLRHVDLRGTIAEAFACPLDGWSNDLHPMNDGFKALAARLRRAIQALP